MSTPKRPSTGSALYYPYIHPRDLNAIKASLLLWDRVRRIVPSDVRSGDGVWDDDDDSKYLTDAGLLVATDPAICHDAAQRRCLKHIGPQAHRFELTAAEAKSLFGGGNPTRLGLGLIHVEKFGAPILRWMEGQGLAEVRGPWVGLHDEVGRFYMYCLAREMGAAIGAELFSDSEDEAEIGKVALFAPDDDSDLTDVVATLGIHLPSAADVASVSVRDIVRFSAKHAGERQRFRVEMEAIAAIVGEAGTREAMEDLLASRRLQFGAAVTDLRATLDELGVGAGAGVAKLSVPAAAGLLAAGVAPYLPFLVDPSLLGLTGITIGAMSVFAETRGKVRVARRTSKFHYLLSLEQWSGLAIAPGT